MKAILVICLLLVSNIGFVAEADAQGCPRGRPCGAVCCP
jgi:hypothetical protein